MRVHVMEWERCVSVEAMGQDGTALKGKVQHRERRSDGGWNKKG